ncbi:MAG: hypothetical protein ABI833_18440 [Acidobacteriota bacterium]
MQISDERFSAEVELPCKIFCGPDSLLEVAGTAVNIGPASVRLQLDSVDGVWKPLVGESIRLELLLPVKSARAKAKYLSVRARVADVIDTPDGKRRLELRFRKPSFKDRLKEAGEKDSAAPETPRAAHAKWRM